MAIKAAQTFVNSVSIDTKYDNTAFIVALGSILSRGGYSSASTLRKINPTLSKFFVSPYGIEETYEA